MEVSGKLQADLEVCRPCRIEGCSSRADGFCEECDKYMCNRCFSDHLKYKGIKSHVLGSLNQGQAQIKEKDQGTQPCQKHPNYNLRYYCRKHDNVACGDCIVAEHKGCEMEFVKDIAKQFESTPEFTRAAEHIKDIESEYKGNKRKQKKNRRENASMTENVLAEIRRFRNKLNEYLDNAEKEIVMDSKRLSKENDDLISDLEIKVSQVKEDVCHLIETLDTSLYKGDTLFIRFVECKQLVSNVERSLDEIKKKNYIKMFTFHPEERLAELMASKLKLGTIIFVNSKSEETSSARIENATQSAENAVKGPVLSKQAPTFIDPDPRARGFDVGKRVQYKGFWSWTGTVASVDPAGYVYVRWDDGDAARYKAGAEGKYRVKLV